MAIITILFTIIAPSLMQLKTSSADTRRIEDIHQIRVALELYREEKGVYPNDLNELVASGYMSVIPQDPSGNPNYSYIYATSPDASSYILKAFLQGKDRVLQIDYDNDMYGVSCSKDDNAAEGPYDYCLRS